jgi:NADH dehydrogenase FAD-containing subunit
MVLDSPWQQAQAELYKQSKSIIIVGSGAVGVELAGELVSKFSDTSVTLCYPRVR